MRHVLLCALLLLTACQKQDPEGTIQPNAQGHTILDDLAPGDSPPFRLAGGDMESTILPAQSVPRSLEDKCRPTVQLMKYREEKGRELTIGDTGIGGERINGLDAGVYSLRITAENASCLYFVGFIPAKN